MPVVDDPERVERFQAETVPAPDTPCYLTGGADPPGPRRLIFRYNSRLEHAERKLAAGVQLRFGTSLMSVVPPSIHPKTGVQLDWLTRLDNVPLAPLPEEWLARAVSSNGRKEAKSAQYWRELVESHPREGDRHDALISLAGHLAAKGVDARVATMLLCGWARWKCTIAAKRVIADDEIAKAVIYAVRKEAMTRV